MIDKDIETLDHAAGRRPLNHLEADIWRELEARLQANRTLRIFLSCQAAVLAVAVFSSVAVGSHFAMNAMPRPVPSVLSVAADLSPTTRLTGY
jgi:hypothetical protein